jgi:hypothetical protein
VHAHVASRRIGPQSSASYLKVEHAAFDRAFGGNELVVEAVRNERASIARARNMLAMIVKHDPELVCENLLALPAATLRRVRMMSDS